MNTNQKLDILNKFGALITNKVFDLNVNSLDWYRDRDFDFNDSTAFKDLENEIKFIKGLNDEDFLTLKKFLLRISYNSLAEFLGFFEENENFAIIHKSNNEEVNLLEIANSNLSIFHSEIYDEDGWVAKFSKHQEIIKKLWNGFP